MTDYSDLALPSKNDYSDLALPANQENISMPQNMFQPLMSTPTSSLQQAGYETWKNPAAREALKTELLTMMPQFRAFGPIMNALGNIGAGTLATTALDAPEINNLKDLGQVGKKNLEFNTLLQGIGSAMHLPGVFAEIKNPIQYTENKLGEIRNNYQNAVNSQKEAYGNVTNKYGDFHTSLTPEKFLGFSDKTIQHFTPDVEVAYDRYIKNPNFNNLHDLQWIMGNDVNTLRGERSAINQFQSLNKAHRQVQNKIYSLLSRDQNALNEYKRGTDITRDIVKPYEVNNDLKAATLGIGPPLQAQELSNAIKKGSKSIKGQRSGIPEGHYLNTLGKDLDYRLARGKAVTELLPENLRKWMFNIPGHAQNPFVKNVFENYVNPLYYGLGREYISNQAP